MYSKKPIESKKNLQFIMIVNNEEIAKYAVESGVSRLFVDLEYIGKDLRQQGMDTWKSRQTMSDVERIRHAVPNSHLMVRVNPIHEETPREVEQVLERGANSIMLPMFRTFNELSYFVNLVADRAEVVPLVETSAALSILPTILSDIPLTRIHIGLNDLHLDLKMNFMFQPLSDGLLEEIASELRINNIDLGIGGIARSGEGLVSPEYLLGEHVRLGSDAVILSRTLHGNAKNLAELHKVINLPLELKKLIAIYEKYQNMTSHELESNRIETKNRINIVAKLIKNRENQYE